MSDPAVSRFSAARVAARASRRRPGAVTGCAASPPDSEIYPEPEPVDAGLGLLLAQLEAAQAEIDELRRQTEDLGRLATLGTLSATVAHEFNNLLTPPAAYAKMALKDLDRDPSDLSMARKALTKCAQGSEKAQRICSAILSFARGSHASGACTIAHVLDEALLAMGRDLSKDGIHLVRDVPEHLEVAIDPVEFEHVLLNLLINARDAMLAPGGRRGTLRVTAWVGGEDGVAVQVTDTGCGIAPEHLDQIFEPFFTTRAQRPAPTRGDHEPLPRSGTGLGLSLCRQIVQRHGGTLAAASRPGNGSQFTIELPSAARQEAVGEAA